MKHRCLGLGGLALEDVERQAWHEVDVATLVAMHNPLRAWAELKSPIRPEEVHACLAAGQEELCPTPLWSELAFGKASLSAAEARRRHVAKIAYFVRCAPENPISLDVCIPAMGCFSICLVVYGNHRLAGACLAQHSTIRAKVGGAVSHAKELGLWNPNAYERELTRRWLVDQRALRTSQRHATARQRPKL